MYIRSAGNISAQHTFGDVPFLTAPVEYTTVRLNCIEPDYKDIIDPRMIRRMSRIIRMGVAAAMKCLQEGAVKVPDAIVTGTAYGCLQDTDLFLSKMVEQHESLLTPTAFIQSTHNTIGAQIGLMLSSNNYNNAFVHRGFSFESALLDGHMYIMENPGAAVLVGAIDETTDTSHAILKRFGRYKNKPVSNYSLFDNKTKGTIAGEGSSFFLLSDTKAATDLAKIEAYHTFYKPTDIQTVKSQITAFLHQQNLTAADIDLVITGDNGDAENDEVYSQLRQSIFNSNQNTKFKHLCGEYPTAISFAVWLAAKIIQTGTVPAVLPGVNSAKSPKRILIYNHYEQIHHSLFLISAC